MLGHRTWISKEVQNRYIIPVFLRFFLREIVSQKAGRAGEPVPPQLDILLSHVYCPPQKGSKSKCKRLPNAGTCGVHATEVRGIAHTCFLAVAGHLDCAMPQVSILDEQLPFCCFLLNTWCSKTVKRKLYPFAHPRNLKFHRSMPN